MPPAAKIDPKVNTVHGDLRVDNYFWMRESTDPEVISYLESENAFAESVMKPTEEFQASLYKEILGRIKQTDLSVPYKYGEIGTTQGRKKENNTRCIAANTVRWKEKSRLHSI